MPTDLRAHHFALFPGASLGIIRFHPGVIETGLKVGMRQFKKIVDILDPFSYSFRVLENSNRHPGLPAEYGQAHPLFQE